jgi:hypothetical protein
MEVGQGPNWGRSAKEKKREVNIDLLKHRSIFRTFKSFFPSKSFEEAE